MILITSCFFLQLQTEDNMCTRSITQPMRQERRGSFFKVSAPVIILRVLKRRSGSVISRLILGNTEEQEEWAQELL